MVPVATVDNIDLTVGGLTALYVVPAGKIFVPTLAIVRENGGGLIVGTATYNVQRLSDSAVSLVGQPGIYVSQADAYNACDLDSNTSGDSFVHSGDTVDFNISTPAGGTGFLVSVDLFGYLI